MKKTIAEGTAFYSRGNMTLGSAILLVISLIMTVFNLVSISGDVTGGKQWSLVATLSCYIWLMVYLACSYMHHRTVYLYSSAYLICLFLFHMGLTIQHAFGVQFSGEWKVGKFTVWLELAAWYTALSLSSFGIGFALAPLFIKNRRVPAVWAAAQQADVYRVGRWMSYGMLIASAIFFIMAIKSYGNLLSYSRADIFRSSADSRGFGVFMMVFPGAVWLYLLTAQTKKHYLIGFGLVLFSFALFMLSGYRSAALFSCLIGVISWVKTGRKLPTSLAVGAVIFVLMAISFVGVFRQLGTYGELDSSAIEKSLEETSIVGGLDSMGGTANGLAHVLKLVPDTDPHRWGSSYWRALADSIPNIGLNIDSQYSRQTIKDEVKADPSALNKMPPSDWLTFRILREQFDLGQGVGFTAIGEAYLNFGNVGVVVFFTLLGAGLCYLDSVNIVCRYKLFIFVTAMLWPLIRTVRNDAANFTKPAMFMLIILFAWWLFSRYALAKRLSMRRVKN